MKKSIKTAIFGLSSVFAMTLLAGCGDSNSNTNNNGNTNNNSNTNNNTNNNENNHTHAFNKEIATDAFKASAATCTEPAKYFYSCECGEKGTQTFNSGEALGHSYTNYVSNNNATCTTDGTKTAKCDRCDESNTQTEAGTAKGHSFTNYVSNNDATCTADGTKTAKCDRCDERSTQTEAGTAKGHSFTNYVSNNDATCTADGTKTAKCDRCDERSTIADSGTKTAHTFNQKNTEAKYLASEATCTESAKYFYSCECGEKGTEIFSSGEPLSHSFTNYVSNNNATHTSDGTKTAKCDRCDVTDTIPDNGSKIPHTFNQKNTAAKYLSSEATCTEPAKYFYSCECGEKGTEIFSSGEALGHSFAKTYSYDNEYHWYAATCGHDVVSGKEAHSFGDPVIVSPTLEANGSKTFTCKCGYSCEEPISNDYLVYTYQNPTEQYLRSEATCAAPATYFYTDENGNPSSTLYYEYGYALPHDYVINEVDGRLVATCKNCNFNSANDYSTKNDNELTKENLVDIILNSVNVFTSVLEYYGSYYTCYYIPGGYVTAYGNYTDGVMEEPYDYSYSMVRPLGNNVYFSENGSFYIENNEILDRTSYRFNIFEGNVENNFDGIVQNLIFNNFVYDETANRYFVYDYENNELANFEIIDKQITDIYSENIGTYVGSDFPSVFEEVKNPYYSIEIEDGVYSTIMHGCEHGCVTYHVDEDGLYMECLICGEKSNECGDIEGDVLTPMQISNLLSNSRIGMICYENDEPKGLPVIFDQNLTLKFVRGEKFYWEYFNDVNDEFGYWEFGEELYGINYSSKEDSIQNSLESAMFADYGYYGRILDVYSPIHLASLCFNYDEKNDEYFAYDYDNCVYAFVTINDGAITDIVIRDENEMIAKMTNDFDALGLDQSDIDMMVEDYKVMLPTIEERDGIIGAYLPCFTDPIATSIGLVGSNSSDYYTDIKEFLAEKCGIIYDGSEYMTYDSNTGISTYVYFSPNYAEIYKYGGDTNYEINIDGDTLYFSTYVGDNDNYTCEELIYLIDDLDSVVGKTVTEVTPTNTIENEYRWDGDLEEFVPVAKTLVELSDDGKTEEKNKYIYIDGEYVLSEHYVNTTDGDYNYVTDICYDAEDSENPTKVIYFYQHNTIYGMTIYQEEKGWDYESQSLVGYYKNVYERNEEGNTLHSENYKWNSTIGDWALYSVSDYESINEGYSFYSYIAYTEDGKINYYSCYEREEGLDSKHDHYIYYKWDEISQSFVINYEYIEDKSSKNERIEIRNDWSTSENKFIPTKKDVTEFDEYGNQIRITSYKWSSIFDEYLVKETSAFEYLTPEVENGPYVGTSNIVNTYNIKDLVSQTTFSDWNDEAGRFVAQTSINYQYDDNNNRTTATTYKYNYTTLSSYSLTLYDKYEYSYDENNNEVESIRSEFVDGSYKYVQKWTHEYEDGVLVAEHYYTYNSQSSSWVLVD